MKKKRNSKLFTCNQVAQKLKLTPGRVRQICRDNDIGEKPGRDWFLTIDEIEMIQALPDLRKKHHGR